ncbi:MAG: hypothetical protein EAZ36_01690 [Verrucomicrobia bacterium]|nr:MAG: hypothetical protein EAZ36_01690 [Verrucomicrobiota bacterium]
MIFMFLMVFGLAAWFFSDGYIIWPAEGRRHVVFTEMAEKWIAEGKGHDLKDPAIIRAWEKYAKEQGWKTKVPKERTDGDLAGQRWAAWVLTTISTVFAGWIIWSHTRSVRADGDMITGVCGEKVHLDSIVEMDRRKWADKGIAYAIYEVGGKRSRLTLDDHKFLGCEAIILEAESRMAARAAASGAAAGSQASATKADQPKTS